MSSLAQLISFDPAADDPRETKWLWHGLVAAGRVTPFTRRRKLFGWSRSDATPRQLLIELSPDGRRYDRLADGPDEFHAHWDVASGLPGSTLSRHSRSTISLTRPRRKLRTSASCSAKARLPTN